MNNIDTKFEIIYNANVFDRITMNGKTRSLWDIILSIKVNKILLFVGVEQGSGSNDDIVFVSMTLNLRNEAQW